MTTAQLKDTLWRRRYPVSLTFILVLGVFVALASLREPTWTAQARLNVGQSGITAQSVPGYAVGVQSLAASYSRAIVATEVTDPIAKAFRTEREDIEERLTASPIPESSLIVVEGTGSDEASAIRMTNAGAEQLVRYADRRSAGDDKAADLLKRFQAASVELARAQSRVATLERGDSSRSELDDARGDVARAKLQAETISELYRSSVQSTESGDLISVLTDATTATSDRVAAAQRLGGTGLFVGLLLALFVGLVPTRRSRRSAAPTGGRRSTWAD